jgi:hypothetical protein
MRSGWLESGPSPDADRMSLPSWIRPRPWIAALVAVLAFGLWSDVRRAQRVAYVSRLTEVAPRSDPASASGYAGGVRHLTIPAHNLGSFEWIAQTQQMLAEGGWRVRHVSYDNHPAGREVRRASLYRWWLAALASVDQAITDRPAGVAVEDAALYADPLLRLLLLLSLTLFVARRFGGRSAAGMAAALGLLFPYAACSLPGQPDDQTLVLGAVLWSLVAGLAGWQRGGRGWFALAGLLGGIALWADVSVGVPLVVGIAVGGVLQAWVMRGRPDAEVRPAWGAWGLGGAAAVWLGVLLDYYPDAVQLHQLDALHPLYGLAWLGLAGLLAAATDRISGRTARSRWLGLTRVGGAAIALGALPAIMVWQHSRGFLIPPLLSGRISDLPETGVAPDLITWLGAAAPVASLATLLPLMLVVVVGWVLLRGEATDPRRATLAWALGPVAVALGFALLRMRWWAVVDATLVVLLVAATGPTVKPLPALVRAAWGAGVAMVLAWSFLVMVPRGSATAEGIAKSEVESLIERDLAHWLAARVPDGKAVVLAPPELAASLIHYGGFRTLSTPYRENHEGFAAAVRIVSAALADEAYALAKRREVTHIVIPSWDNSLDEYARLSGTPPEKTLIGLLHQWLPPRWLRPVAYQMPAIPGFEGGTVVVFEVVDLQDDATSLSRLAEYFVESGDLDSAAKVADALMHWYPEDVGALVARAGVERARGNAVGFARCLTALEPSLGSLEDLAWERRVMLSLVLAEARRLDAAREQLRRSFADMDDSKLRSLTTGTLYRVLALARVAGLPITNSKLRQTAWELLPADLRDQLEALPAGAPPAGA